MTNTKLLHNSFNAGEISPELFSRPDIQQFRFGAARARNWITRPSGSAQLRPGFEIVSTLASKARAAPFKAEGDDFVVTVEAGRFRFWRAGRPVSVFGGANDVYVAGDQTRPGVVDLVNNVINTGRKHDITLGQLVLLTSTGTPPGGTATVFNYLAVPQGPREISLDVSTVGPNAYDTLTTTGLSDVSEAWAVNFYVGFWVWVYDADGNVVGRSQITANTATTLTFNEIASAPAGGTYRIAQAVNISSYNSGTLFVWKISNLPEDYQLPIPMSASPIPSSDTVITRPSGASFTRVTLSGPHGWPIGTRWKWVGAGTPPATRAWNQYSVSIPYDGREFNLCEPDAATTLTTSQFAAEQPNPFTSGVGSGVAICVYGAAAFVAPVSAARIYPAGTVLFLRSAVGDFSAGDFIRASQDIVQSAAGPLLADGWVAATGTPWLEIPNSYTESELFELTFAQTEKTLRFAHKNHATLDLERLDDGTWTYRNALDAPVVDLAPSVTVNRGQQIGISNTNGAGNLIVTNVDHGIAPGDLLYISGSTTIAAGFYVSGAAAGLNITQLMTLAGASFAPSGSAAGGTIVVVESTARSNQRYIVTAIDENGREFARSTPTASTFNTLSNAEAYNSISWTTTPAAAGYRIYKEEDGTELFGFIAETGAPPFLDRNIEPDFARLAPEIDDELRTDYPAAVAFYDQRGVFGGNTAKPQGLWLSALGRDNELTTRRTQLDTDRIALEIESREGQFIRHIVPVSELLVLSDTTEWALATRNTDTLTPTSATIRLQTTVGSSYVRPLVMNNSVLFVSPGSHVYRLGYQLAEGSFGGSNLSTRAAHLFDKTDLVDSSSQTARLPVGWFTTAEGSLLGLTYSEEEQVAGWHRHDMAAARFISTAVATEGTDDRLYAVTQLDSGAYYLQRMGKTNPVSLLDTGHLDFASRYSGSTEHDFPITVTGSTNVGGSLRVTSTGHAFGFAQVGQTIVFGTGLRATIDTRIDAGEVRCTVTAAGALPASGASYAITTSVVPGLLAGTAVLEAADGTVSVRELTPDSYGRVTLPFPCTTVHFGVSFANELRTMPVAAQLEATGQGRMKHVDHAYVRVFESGALSVGPDLDHLSTVFESYKTGQQLTEETRELIESQWSRDGQLSISQRVPIPCIVTGVTFDVSFA